MSRPGPRTAAQFPGQKSAHGGFPAGHEANQVDGRGALELQDHATEATCYHAYRAGMRCHLVFDADDTSGKTTSILSAFEEFVDFLGHSALTAPRSAPCSTRSKPLTTASTATAAPTSHEISSSATATWPSVKSSPGPRPHPLLRRAHPRPAHRANRWRRADPGRACPAAFPGLFTKGDPDEQRIKIDRSGLAGYFPTPSS